MNKNLAALMMAASVLGSAGANADIISGTVTADNHYSLYTSTGGVFSYHGGNELGAAGSQGAYNWSVAESYQFEAGDFLYIAAWSDDQTAQGVLAQFQSDSLGVLLSGDPRWQVYGTGINRGDGDAHPDIFEIEGHVTFADSNSLWENPFTGATNGVQPWGTIAGISNQSAWMWSNVDGDPDPLNGGSGGSEMLIFRTVAPAPGSAALFGLGALVAIRRQRRIAKSLQQGPLERDNPSLGW